jgi:hypothetical protein
MLTGGAGRPRLSLRAGTENPMLPSDDRPSTASERPNRIAALEGRSVVQYSFI